MDTIRYLDYLIKVKGLENYYYVDEVGGESALISIKTGAIVAVSIPECVKQLDCVAREILTDAIYFYGLENKFVALEGSETDNVSLAINGQPRTKISDGLKVSLRL